MVRYVSILGNNYELSFAELKAVLPRANFLIDGGTYAQFELEDEIDCTKLLRQLGGTIKIGRIISDKVSKENIIEDLLRADDSKKIVFGISEYYARVKSIDLKYKTKIQHLGMEIKKELKEGGRSVRFVVSRDPVLSSVVIAKNKCQEYMILDNALLAKTCAVQEFEEYSERDYGRPARDAKSGMLPPKLSKMMINLSQAKHDDILLDPFCGSGTIVQEAIVLGFKNVIGCDISEKAVEDTKKNLEWLEKSYKLSAISYQLFVCDVRKLGSHAEFISASPGDTGGSRNKFGMTNGIDVIVTEPYLGPAMRGNESREDIFTIKAGLEKLYLDTFREFFKILKKGGRVVIIVPRWKFGENFIYMNIKNGIESLGFAKINTEELLYSRSDQRVVREIVIFQKK